LSAADRVAVLNRLLKLTNRLLVPFAVHLEKRHRISVNEFRVLMLIGEHGQTAAHELATALGVNTMAVSRAVAALATRGLVAARVDPASRRRKSLTLTAEGEKMFGEMLPSTLKVADYLLDALGPGELGQLDRLVTTLTERLEAEDGQGRSLFLERTRPDSPAAGVKE